MKAKDVAQPARRRRSAPAALAPGVRPCRADRRGAADNARGGTSTSHSRTSWSYAWRAP